MPFEFFRFILTPKKEAELRKGIGLDVYGELTIPLDIARNNEEFRIKGDHISVVACDATDNIDIRFNTTKNKALDLRTHRRINTPFIKFYISNVAQEGKSVTIFIGGEGAAECVPLKPTKVAKIDGAEINPSTDETLSSVLDNVEIFSPTHLGVRDLIVDKMIAIASGDEVDVRDITIKKGIYTHVEGILRVHGKLIIEEGTKGIVILEGTTKYIGGG